MEILAFGRFALSVAVAAASLAGCAGLQPPIGASGAMPQGRAMATRADRGGSWMLKEARTEPLLYVTTASATVDKSLFLSVSQPC